MLKVGDKVSIPSRDSYEWEVIAIDASEVSLSRNDYTIGIKINLDLLEKIN